MDPALLAGHAPDEHTIGIVILGLGLGALAYFLKRLVGGVDAKLDKIAENQQVHGERLVKVETVVEATVRRVDGLEDREREEVTGSHRIPHPVR
jgi:hypothetical protein